MLKYSKLCILCLKVCLQLIIMRVNRSVWHFWNSVSYEHVELFPLIRDPIIQGFKYNQDKTVLLIHVVFSSMWYRAYIATPGIKHTCTELTSELWVNTRTIIYNSRFIIYFYTIDWMSAVINTFHLIPDWILVLWRPMFMCMFNRRWQGLGYLTQAGNHKHLKRNLRRDGFIMAGVLLVKFLCFVQDT